MSAERDSYAYFTITSSGSLQQIEDCMGTSGDGNCWSKGDRRPSNKSTYAFSRWSMLSGVERGQPIEDHLQALWRRLSVHREQIIRLPDHMFRSVSCVGVFNTRHAKLEISAGHFATAAYFGVTLDCDFYFDEEMGDDDDDTPWWSR